MSIAYPRASLPSVAVTVACVLSAASVEAASIGSGSLTLNLDRDALIAGSVLNTYPDAPTASFPICCRPSIYLEEFFDATAAANRSFEQIREDNTPDLYDLTSDEINARGLNFKVNGDTVPNPQGRANRPTTFSFDPARLFATASGEIGLGGVMRFRVDVDPPTNRVMVGDLSLEYHPELEGATPGRSGWLLVNHIGFPADAFELFNVTATLAGGQLTLDGELGFGWGFDHVGATAARARQVRIGDFHFQAAVVPVPPALLLFGSGLLGLGLARIRRADETTRTHS